MAKVTADIQLVKRRWTDSAMRALAWACAFTEILFGEKAAEALCDHAARLIGKAAFRVEIR